MVGRADDFRLHFRPRANCGTHARHSHMRKSIDRVGPECVDVRREERRVRVVPSAHSQHSTQRGPDRGRRIGGLPHCLEVLEPAVRAEARADLWGDDLVKERRVAACERSQQSFPEPAERRVGLVTRFESWCTAVDGWSARGSAFSRRCISGRRCVSTSARDESGNDKKTQCSVHAGLVTRKQPMLLAGLLECLRQQ